MLIFLSKRIHSLHKQTKGTRKAILRQIRKRFIRCNYENNNENKATAKRKITV